MIEFACEAICSWTFVCWKFINRSFNLSTWDPYVHIFYFFLIYSWKIVLFKNLSRSSHHGTVETNLTRNHEVWSSIAVSCGVGHRWGLDLALLWLWLRPAVALIRPLAWEPPYAMDVALKKSKKKKRICLLLLGCPFYWLAFIVASSSLLLFFVFWWCWV